jgi:hypothetical protein
MITMGTVILSHKAQNPLTAAKDHKATKLPTLAYYSVQMMMIIMITIIIIKHFIAQ